MDLPDIELVESITGERIMPPDPADAEMAAKARAEALAPSANEPRSDNPTCTHSVYTPTTEEVREAWLFAARGKGRVPRTPGTDHGAQFDLWLKERLRESSAT